MIVDWKGPLLPCPFCGGRAVMEQVDYSSIGISSFSVGCTDDDGGKECMGYQSLTTFSRRSDAANGWNTRDGKLVIVVEGS